MEKIWTYLDIFVVGIYKIMNSIHVNYIMNLI